MSVGPILTQGLGVFGSVNLLPTLGYGIAEQQKPGNLIAGIVVGAGAMQATVKTTDADAASINTNDAENGRIIG